MTDLALPLPASLDISKSALPSVPSPAKIAETAGLVALDSAGRLVSTVEQVLDGGAELANATVPAVTRFIGGFLLPEHANRIVGTISEYGTKIATFLGVSTIKGAAQTLTFGAPAWIDASRQWLGVSAITGELDHDDQSNEFLARCIAKQSADPMISDALLQYLDLRKELRKFSALPQQAPEEVAALSHKIASLEIRLREYQDFSELKQVLNQGEQFIAEQHKKISTIARRTAEQIIDNIGNYYQDRCGSFAGEVEGAWTTAATEDERAKRKEELTLQIAKRLQGVFERTLNESETEAELQMIARDLHTSFSSYGKATKAALFTIFGVGYATGAFNYLAEAAGNALKGTVGSIYDWTRDTATSAWESLKGYVHHGFKSASDALYNSASDAVNHAVQNNPVIQTITSGVETVQHTAETVTQTADSVTSAVSDTLENATNAVSDFFSSGSPDYSNPYWWKTNKVMMGYSPDGTPLWGESCISGFPSRPRMDPGGFSLKDFDLMLNRAPLSPDLLKPSDAPPLDPKTATELLKMLQGK